MLRYKKKSSLVDNETSVFANTFQLLSDGGIFDENFGLFTDVKKMCISRKNATYNLNSIY